MKCSEFKAGIVSHEIFRDRGSENLNPATVGKRIPLFVDSEIRLGREGRLGVLLQLLANLMDFPGKPDEYIMLKLGSVRLELFPTDSAQTVNANGGEQVIGFKHLAFEVPRLEPAIAALRADGIEPDPIIDLGDVTPGFRIVFFRDREGNILELMEGYRDEER